MVKALQLTQDDTIATALQEIDAGQIIEVVLSGQKVGETIAKEKIPYGFKVCVSPMSAGDAVIKYGHVIGKASKDIAPGEMVHVHNIEGNRGRGDLAK